jgi:hypothetical protein
MENGQSSPESHVSLLGLGRPWTRVGQGVFVLCILAFVMWRVMNPILPYVKGDLVPVGYRLVSNKDGGFFLRASIWGAISVFLLVFSGLGAFVWTFADIIDRRKRFVWLLPMFICPFIFGLQALPLGLYLFFGRETPDPDQNVK